LVLAVESRHRLALLPGAQPVTTDGDGDGLAFLELLLQRRRPMMPGMQVPVVLQHAETPLAQGLCQPLDASLVAAVVAEEEVELRSLVSR
jgi:hypothetical protein